jgi:hypothetical protein
MSKYLVKKPETRKVRRAMAEAVGLDFQKTSSVKFCLVDGDQPPVLDGRCGGHYTRGGVPIRHPGAYSRRGWSNVRYLCDSRVITAGVGWAMQHGYVPDGEMGALAALCAQAETSLDNS